MYNNRICIQRSLGARCPMGWGPFDATVPFGGRRRKAERSTQNGFQMDRRAGVRQGRKAGKRREDECDRESTRSGPRHAKEEEKDGQFAVLFPSRTKMKTDKNDTKHGSG